MLTEVATDVAAKVVKNTDRTTAVAIFIGISIAVAIMYFATQNVWPCTVIVQDVNAAVKSAFAALQPVGVQLQKYFNAYPVQSVGSVLAVGGGVYGIISKIRSDRARMQAETLAAQKISEAQRQLIDVSQQHAQLQVDHANLQKQLETYTSDTSFEEAKQLITQQSAQLDQKASTIQELENIISDLKQKTVVQVH